MSTTSTGNTFSATAILCGLSNICISSGLHPNRLVLARQARKACARFAAKLNAEICWSDRKLGYRYCLIIVTNCVRFPIDLESHCRCCFYNAPLLTPVHRAKSNGSRSTTSSPLGFIPQFSYLLFLFRYFPAGHSWSHIRSHTSH